ncbi:MAG: hypothetical protein JRJ19_00170, partial [Deltaproteobacteria bacterium]|nr:hypothetical protein [Deltaproteobacteria bacterium]
MSGFSGSQIKKRYLSRLIGLVAFAIIFCSIPQKAEAQSAVVASFTGKAKKLRRRARTAIVKAMADQGIKLVSYKQYLRKAKRSRIRRNKA